jgi:predicted DNA-binding ribbon-helix-helix protein
VSVVFVARMKNLEQFETPDDENFSLFLRVAVTRWITISAFSRK